MKKLSRKFCAVSFFSLSLLVISNVHASTVTFTDVELGAGNPVTKDGVTLTTSNTGGSIDFLPSGGFAGVWLGKNNTSGHYTLSFSETVSSIEFEFEAFSNILIHGAPEALSNFTTNSGGANISYTDQVGTVFDGSTITPLAGVDNAQGVINFSGLFNSFSFDHNQGAQSGFIIERIVVTTVPPAVAPIATPDTYSVSEDGVLTVPATGVLANDHDASINPLTAVLDTHVSNGVLTLAANGGFTYTPTPLFSGTDTFSYHANNGTVDSNIVTVTITVNPINHAPVAHPDAAVTAEDTPLTVTAILGVLSNDSDPDGDSLTAQLVVPPSNGTVHLNLDGSFSYQPNTNFNGTDSFSYKVNDGKLDSAPTIVNLTVHALNDAPLGANDSYNTQEDTPIKVAAANGLLANDIDIDGDVLQALIISPPASGHVNLSLDGSFTYTPNQDFNGIDSFTYQVSDGVVASADITVTINVHAANDAPVAADDSYSVAEDGLLKVTLASGLLVNDHDADANSLRVALGSPASNGAIHMSLDGSFTYKPVFGFSGTDNFTYKANDGKVDSNEVTVTITVNHTNHPTLPNGDAYTVAQDGVLSVTVTNGLLANDLDTDGDALLVTNIPTSVSHGTLHINLDGSFNYTPTPGYSGPDNFTYIVNDGSVDSAPVTVNLTVNHNNHEPLAADDVYSLAQGGVLTIPAQGLLANDLDIDGDKLVVLIQTYPLNGTLHQDLDGGFTYQPAPGFQGSDSYTYLASDSQLNSQIVTVTLHVNHTNHAPLAGDDNYSTPSDTVLQISVALGVLNNDTDQDADVLAALIVAQPQHGTVQLNNDGSFKYTPTAGYAGQDSFSYKARDSLLDSNIATVAVDVHFTNQPPVAIDDQYSIATDTSLQVSTANGILANDTDADGNTLQMIILSQPQHGSLHVLADGGFTYQPDPGYAGSDTFTYKASDGNADSNVATASITVHALNQAPVVQPTNHIVPPNTALQIDVHKGVLTGATDLNNNLIHTLLISGPTHGTLHLNKDGSFTYTPDPGYTGKDQFIIAGTDNHSKSVQVAIILNVSSGLNPTPVPAKPIPTLSQWAVVLLSLLMLSVAGRLRYWRK